MDGTRNPGSSPVLVAFSVGSAGSGGQSGGWPPAPLATRQAPLSMIDGANNTFPSGLMIKQWPCLGWIQIQLPLLSRKQQPPLMSGNLSRSSRTRKLQRRQRRRAKPSRIVLGPRTLLICAILLDTEMQARPKDNVPVGWWRLQHGFVRARHQKTSAGGITTWQ